MNVTLDKRQKAAVEHAAQHKDCIITGGAGTGKTLTIQAIAERYDNQVVLMAPTGKAAAQIRDRTGLQAYTIHRTLLYDGVDFRLTTKIQVPAIIDEASMIDSSLMHHTLRYCRGPVILVGDAAQLPPVGPGEPFHDLIRFRPYIVFELQKCYRASGAIHMAAQSVRAGKPPEKQHTSGGEVWQMIQTGPAQPTINRIVQWVKDGKYDPMQDMILAPVYGGGEDDGGIDAINTAVKAVLNPSDKGAIAVGDRVLCNKNFAADDLWNGDIGTVTAIDSEKEMFIKLDRDAEERQCDAEKCRNIKLAYCMSVHKAQGSQARRVFFVCLNRHARMLSRALIYTGCTRAREACVVCGELQAFYRGLGQVTQKQTVLKHLFKMGEAVAR
jgi:exodeoxyribonuclease V alpha subunit